MNKWWVFSGVIFLSLLASVFLTDNAEAAYFNGEWYREPRNASEDRAWAYRQSTGSCGQGAMWFNDKNGSYGPPGRDQGYYSTGIAPVEADQEYVVIYLHGSAAMGGKCKIDGEHFYAIDIASETDRLKIHGKALWRGEASDDGWTTQGNSLAATLDIRGLAKPGDPIGTEFPVKIWRCGSFNGIDKAGPRCGAETIKIKITRKAHPWRIEAGSYIRKETNANRNQEYLNWVTGTINVKVGDVINFKHTARARDSKISTWVKHIVRGQNLPPGPDAGKDGDPNIIRLTWRKDINKDQEFMNFGPYPGGRDRNSMRYTVRPGDAGKLLCQRSEWQPSDYRGNGQGETSWVCAIASYEYALKPSIDIASSTVLLGQNKVSGVRGAVYNSGPTYSQETRSGVVRFIARGDQTINDAGDNVKMNIDNPCEVAAHITGRNGLDLVAGSCKDIYKDGSDRKFGLNQTTIHSSDDDISDISLQLGDRVCYATVVAAYKQNIGKDTSSYAVKCIAVSKRPKVQFLGGDVRAGVSIANSINHGTIQTSITVLDDRRYGSWAEYDMLASGDIFSSSGAGLSGGGSLGAPAREYNQLTFRNTKTPFGQFGRITGYQYPPIPAASGSLKIDSSRLASSGEYKANYIELEGGVLAKGAMVTLQAKTVRITGNVSYLGDLLASASEVPQLIIRADHIIIEPNVQRVDGWLLANKTVSTCAEAKNGKGWPEANLLESGACDKEQLQINGPIATGSLYLRRTHGSEQGDLDRPAEILNLRPDVYLARYGQSRDSGAIQTMYSRELPPRF